MPSGAEGLLRNYIDERVLFHKARVASLGQINAAPT
jgi:hypothetical protein